MASFTDALTNMVRERDRAFLLKISTEYSLPFEELEKKFLETKVTEKPPRKYKTKSVTTVEITPVEKQCCTALTSKKEACKFQALKGEVFCKRHLKKPSTGTSEETKKEPKKTKTTPQPVHTHALGEAPSEPCDLCESHGDPFEPEKEFEVVPKTLKAIIAAVDEESEPEHEDQLMLEEEYDE